MLGRFLEYSIETPDIRASLDFYTRLGFSELTVGETFAHPYAVVSDGRLCLGLHQLDDFAPSLTFVRPGLLKFLGALDGFALEFEIRRLGNDVFNEVGWRDPSGHLIRLVEARTFSPATRADLKVSRCGYFEEIALPAANREDAKRYWERFGFVGIDEEDAPLPHVACTSDTVGIGLYDPRDLRLPTLVFVNDDVAGTLKTLAEAGIDPKGRVPAALRQVPCASFTAPEGTPLLLITDSRV